MSTERVRVRTVDFTVAARLTNGWPIQASPRSRGFALDFVATHPTGTLELTLPPDYLRAVAASGQPVVLVDDAVAPFERNVLADGNEHFVIQIAGIDPMRAEIRYPE